jgi:hypothetical protein
MRGSWLTNISAKLLTEFENKEMLLAELVRNCINGARKPVTENVKLPNYRHRKRGGLVQETEK